MRKLLIITLLLLSVGLSQQIIHTETYENGNIKNITYHKKTRYKIEKVKFVKYYENGQKKSEETYKNGKLDGLGTYWYENGQMKSKGTTEDWRYDGLEDGLVTLWYDNGQKYFEGTYKDGKLDGLGTWWYENGQKEEEGTYKNGEKDGLWYKWYENGQKKQEGTYKDNIPDGEYKCWNKDGGVIYETEFVNGTGVLIEFSENEQMGEEMIYKNGEIIEFKFFELNYNKD